MNVANTLTTCRLLSIIPLLFLINSSIENHFLYAGVLFSIAGATDVFDGWLARKLNQATEFGGFMDAVTDKVLVYGVIFSLFQMGVYPYYIVFPIFVRDIIVDGLRSFSAKQGVVLPANPFGKIKMLLQVVSVVSGLLFLHTAEQIVFFYLFSNSTLALAFVVSLFGVPVLYQKHKRHNQAK